MARLSGKVATVVGGADGPGEAIAVLVPEEGAVLDLDKEGGERVAEGLAGSGAKTARGLGMNRSAERLEA